MFPCVPGGKEPVIANGHLKASTDRAQIDWWWQANPNANVGIAVAPSGLVVLDVDVGKKADGTEKRGRESLAKIEHELTATLLAETGRGGTHAVYERPQGVEPRRIIGIIEKDSGLDLIGDGYIIAAPSYNAESGRYYRWTQQMAIAPLPPFLQAVAKAPRTQGKVEMLGTPIAEGGRNNALFALGCALRETGIGGEALARALDAENKHRFNPPVGDAELGTIINSVLNRVQVTRDVAAGAIVQQEIQAIFAPKPRAVWLEDEAQVDVPPTEFYDSGIPELNEKLGGGYAVGQVTGVIAPPSAGKSSFVGHTLLTLQVHRPVLHASLELMRRELVVRYASNKLARSWRDGMKGQIPKADLCGALKGVRIKLMGCEDLDANDPLATIEAEARAMLEQTGVAPFIAVDYVQLLARGTEDKKNAVGVLTKRLRIMAQQLNTVILAVFSTGRGFYSNAALEKIRAADDPTAYLGAAKESGDVEFDCANIFFLDVDKTHIGTPKPARLAVARSRYGDIGFVGLHAALDIGRWLAAPEALHAFDAEVRKAKSETDTLEGDCKKLLAAIETFPGQAIGQLQTSSKLSGTRWKNAREHLEASKSIALEDIHKDGRRVPNARTLVKLAAASPPSEPQQEYGHDDS